MDNLGPPLSIAINGECQLSRVREPSPNSVCICVMADVTRVSMLRPLPRRVAHTVHAIMLHASCLHRIIPQTRTLPNWTRIHSRDLIFVIPPPFFPAPSPFSPLANKPNDCMIETRVGQISRRPWIKFNVSRIRTILKYRHVFPF